MQTPVMPAALTSLLNASSSISPPPVVSSIGMLPPDEFAPLRQGNQDHPSRLSFDEIDSLLDKPLPEPGNVQTGSPYQISSRQHRKRHQHNRKHKRRATDHKKRSTILSSPNQPKYMVSRNSYFVKVANGSVLLDRNKSEEGKFNFTPHIKSQPRDELTNTTVGHDGSRQHNRTHTVFIQAMITQLFLCMDRRGRMYAAPDRSFKNNPDKMDECLFQQEPTGNDYYYYSSVKYPLPGKGCKRRTSQTSKCRWYLYVREKNSVARLRAYKTDRRPNKQGTHFLELPVTTNNYGTPSPHDSFVSFGGKRPTTTPLPPTRDSGSRYSIRRPQPPRSIKGKRKGKGPKYSGDCNSNSFNLLSNCSRRVRYRGGRKKSRKEHRKKGKKETTRTESIFRVRGHR